MNTPTVEEILMTEKKLLTYLHEHAEIEIEALPEHASIDGNCSALDEEANKEAARWVRQELDNGNQWAWCVAKVTVSYQEVEASSYLGCCSYKSQEDFMIGGYYVDMLQEAIEELASNLLQVAARIDGVIR